MDWLIKAFNWFEGKKTYFVALTAAILALVEQGLEWQVPEAVYIVLGALGLATLRQGVKKAELPKD